MEEHKFSSVFVVLKLDLISISKINRLESINVIHTTSYLSESLFSIKKEAYNLIVIVTTVRFVHTGGVKWKNRF